MGNFAKQPRQEPYLFFSFASVIPKPPLFVGSDFDEEWCIAKAVHLYSKNNKSHHKILVERRIDDGPIVPEVSRTHRECVSYDAKRKIAANDDYLVENKHHRPWIRVYRSKKEGQGLWQVSTGVECDSFLYGFFLMISKTNNVEAHGQNSGFSKCSQEQQKTQDTAYIIGHVSPNKIDLVVI